MAQILHVSLMRLQNCNWVALTIGMLFAAPYARAGFVDYIIRGTPTINHPNPGQTELLISANGQKAALGSNDINGQTLGDLQSVAITRLDDRTRFASGSGPNVAPYLNIWITNGAGKFAVVANEPSDPAMQALYSNGWDLSFADLSDKVVKVYETSDKSWLPNNGVNLKFSALADFTIQAPSASQLSVGWTGLGSGAPRELGTNLAYGVNWIFGDTLSNYVSGAPGYLVSDASVTGASSSVPDSTASLALLAVSVLGLLMGKKFSRVRE